MRVIPHPNLEGLRREKIDDYYLIWFKLNCCPSFLNWDSSWNFIMDALSLIWSPQLLSLISILCESTLFATILLCVQVNLILTGSKPVKFLRKSHVPLGWWLLDCSHTIMGSDHWVKVSPLRRFHIWVWVSLLRRFISELLHCGLSCLPIRDSDWLSYLEYIYLTMIEK